MAKRSMSKSSKSLIARKMSTTYVMGNSSSTSSNYGVNKLTFGQKIKKKQNPNTMKDISEAEYENLCMDVTKRIINNRQRE